MQICMIHAKAMAWLKFQKFCCSYIQNDTYMTVYPIASSKWLVVTYKLKFDLHS